MQYGIFLCLAQLFIGSLLVGLAIWKLSIQQEVYMSSDWPLYSGVVVLLSGCHGLVLVSCCRYYYPGSKHHTCVFPITTTSIVSNKLHKITLFYSLYFFSFYVFSPPSSPQSSPWSAPSPTCCTSSPSTPPTVPSLPLPQGGPPCPACVSVSLVCGRMES